MPEYASAPVSLQTAAVGALLALAGLLTATTLWVRARAAREERERRATGAHLRRESDTSGVPDRSANVLARIREIDRARLRMPATWEADVGAWADARAEAKVAPLRVLLAELEARVNDLAADQGAMRASWEPVLAALRSLTAAVEERLPCLDTHRDEHPQARAIRPTDRPRGER